MKATKIVVLMCLCGVASVASAKDSLKDQLKAHAEQAVLSMLPTNAVNEAAGFFGPVTKKYLPTFEKFRAEFRTTTNKLSVVERYLPKAKEAYAEAKAMKIPEKYAAKKEEYLKMFDKFLSAVDMAVAAFGTKMAEKEEKSDAK